MPSGPASKPHDHSDTTEDGDGPRTHDREGNQNSNGRDLKYHKLKHGIGQSGKMHSEMMMPTGDGWPTMGWRLEVCLRTGVMGATPMEDETLAPWGDMGWLTRLPMDAMASPARRGPAGAPEPDELWGATGTLFMTNATMQVGLREARRRLRTVAGTPRGEALEKAGRPLEECMWAELAVMGVCGRLRGDYHRKDSQGKIRENWIREGWHNAVR